VWGQVNYDSEGDCRVPTDRAWTWLDLENRETRERLSVKRDGESVIVEGDDPTTARAARFLQARCGGETADPVQVGVGHWSEDGDHARGMARAARVAGRAACDDALGCDRRRRNEHVPGLDTSTAHTPYPPLDTLRVLLIRRRS
jgi:hypothetical protein